MKLLLFTNFNCELPKEFISFLISKYPNLCLETVAGETDFNRWDIALRTHRQVFSAIKAYEKIDTSLSVYFKYSTIKTTSEGYIQVTSDTGEEVWSVK